MDYNRFGYYNFLAYSFAHNTTIPLPGNTLGAMVTVRPTTWLNLRGGFSNVDQTPTEPGFNTFGNGHYLQLYEAAFVTKFFDRDGTYRFLGWYDNKPLPRLTGGGSDSGTSGLALSFDQNLTPKLGLFARYGYTDQRVFQPVQYWSAGFLWTGPLADRPIDSFAVGVLQNVYGQGHRAVTPDSAGNETLFETYYQYELNPYTSVIPTFQFVGNPGGTHRKAEFLLGIHVNLHL